MKRLTQFLFVTVFTLTTFTSFSQCVISSTNGYQVHVTIVPKSVVVSAADCPWGYNYNIGLDYQVSFTGSNIPSALYTLQTTINCGGQSNSFYSLPLNGGNGSGTTTTNPFVANSRAAYQYSGRPDCTHATVQTLSCNSISLLIDGPGISLQTVSCSYTGGMLPVELIDYKGTAITSGVELAWSTASELRNQFYKVYKSTDGENWTETAKISGAGTTTSYNAYAWQDGHPQTGINYYKLTQTDIDGITKDLGIVGVEYINKDASLTSVFPNPSTTGEFNVRVVSGSQSPVEITLRDQMGRVVEQATITESNSFGNSFILQNAMKPMDGQAFYFVEIYQDNALIGREKVEVIRGN